MKKTITLEIETSGKVVDPAFEQSVLDAVEKGLAATSFMVTIKVQAPAPAPAPAPPKA